MFRYFVGDQAWLENWQRSSTLSRASFVTTALAIPVVILWILFATGLGAYAAWVMLVCWILRYLVGLVHGETLQSGAFSPTFFAYVREAKSSNPGFYWCHQISSRVSSATSANSLLITLFAMIVAVVLRGPRRGSDTLPTAFGHSAIYAPWVLSYPSMALEAVLAIWIAQRFPEAATASRIFLVLLWCSLIVHMVSQLLPSLGLRARLFGTRFHPFLVLAAMILLQGVAALVTSSAALAVLKGGLPADFGSLLPVQEISATLQIWKSWREMRVQLSQNLLGLIPTLTIGLWSVLSTRLFLKCIFARRTQEESLEVVLSLLVFDKPLTALKFARKMSPEHAAVPVAWCLLAAGQIEEARAIAHVQPTAPGSLGREQPDLFLFRGARFVAGYPAFTNLLRQWLRSDPPEGWLIILFNEMALTLRQEQRDALLEHAQRNGMFTAAHRLSLEAEHPDDLSADRLCSLNPALHIVKVHCDVVRLLRLGAGVPRDSEAARAVIQRLTALLDRQYQIAVLQAVAAKRSVIDTQLAVSGVFSVGPIMKLLGIPAVDEYLAEAGKILAGGEPEEVGRMQSIVQGLFDHTMDERQFQREPSFTMAMKRPDLVVSKVRKVL